MAGRAAPRIVLGIGLVVIVVARLATPAAPPLYDGVVPTEPYVWLDPPPGERGGAQGATAEIALRNGRSALIAVTTPEPEPQAQIFAQPGGLVPSSSAGAISVAITPVRPAGLPTEGHIDGNVYRITVTDDAGKPLTAPVSAGVSVVLRVSRPPVADATIARFADGAWQRLKTSSTGFGGTFISVVTAFGDFAVILPGSAPSASVAPAESAASTASAMASGSPSIPASPPSTRDAAALPGWLLPGLGLIVAGAGAGAWVVRRRRNARYRGARPMRRR